jgi:hypothetical protein
MTLLHAGGDDEPKFLTIVMKMGRGGGDLGLLGACGKEATKHATLKMEEVQKKNTTPYFKRTRMHSFPSCKL